MSPIREQEKAIFYCVFVKIWINLSINCTKLIHGDRWVLSWLPSSKCADHYPGNVSALRPLTTGQVLVTYCTGQVLVTYCIYKV